MNQHSMSGKHGLIMALCCLIPVAAIFLVSVLGIPLSSLGTVALVLLCPLMHLLMMRGMGGHSHGSQDQSACHETKVEPVAVPASRVEQLAAPATRPVEQPSQQPPVATRN